MPLTTTQKKTLAAAEALLAKKKAQLAELQPQQPSSVANQVSNVQYPTAGLQTTIDPLAAKQPNETNAAYMQRVTQAYKDQPQPTLTPAQEAAGAQVKFVRTGAAGEGEYKIIYPIGVPFDKTTGEPIAGGSSSSSSTTSVPLFSPASSTTATSDLIAAQNQAALDAANLRDRQSAYDLLYNEFNKYGLGSLVDGIKGLIQSNVSPSQFAIELQNTDAYKKRFAANQSRIAAGLQALTPAEYIGLEDQYQNIMRNYGLPASYYTKDSMGTQAGFQKFIANDVSASELEDRIATAQQRVQNSNPEVLQALKQFYPDISNADILSYALDPQNALTNIKRKVTAAEIGGAALAQGLQASGGTAESLAGLGITKAQAQQGYTDIAGILPRGSQLADIYGQQPYTQGTAEAEVFNTAGAADAAARRKKLTSLETAAFSGSSGVGALGRDKSLYGAMQGQAGLY